MRVSVICFVGSATMGSRRAISLAPGIRPAEVRRGWVPVVHSAYVLVVESAFALFSSSLFPNSPIPKLPPSVPKPARVYPLLFI